LVTLQRLIGDACGLLRGVSAGSTSTQQRGSDNDDKERSGPRAISNTNIPHSHPPLVHQDWTWFGRPP
ncbi:MAG TPA: hypothetical protein VLM79_16905, partial [Kofleriaceae bacterium]|nr:hypothetical protein [Kofleriaceae bacterium]